MHAPALTRTTLTRGIGLALVIGLTASVALNVVMLTRSNDGVSQVTAAQGDYSGFRDPRRGATRHSHAHGAPGPVPR